MTEHEMVFRKPGDEIVLTVEFRLDGVLFNPVAVGNVEVYDPTDVLIDTLTPAKVVDGKWAIAYTIPSDGTPGIWKHTWHWTPYSDKPAVSQDYYFSVELPASPAALNKAALDKTVSYYDAEHQDIIWMVCTGANTSPDLQIIFNLVTKSWRTKTMNASALAMDTINPDYDDELILGGDEDGHIFYMGLADDDLGADISCTLETDDKRPDPGNVGQIYEYQEAHVVVRAEGAGQILHMDWFVDESAVEEFAGGVDFTLTTDSVSYRTALCGAGEKLRVRFYNSDDNGPIVLSMWDFGMVPVARAE